MKIDENGVLNSIDEKDIIDGVLTIPEGVKKINWKIDSQSMTYRYMPDGGYMVEPNVTKLIKKIELPSTLIQIGGTGFSGFELIENITIPDSVTEIGYATFRGCTNLKHINLSRNLEKIPDDCFGGCKSLKNIVIPDSVKELGDKIFARCSSLECMYLSKNIEKVGNFDTSDSVLKEIVFPQSMTYSDYDVVADKKIMPDDLQGIGIGCLNSKCVFRTEKAKNNCKAKANNRFSVTLIDQVSVEGNPTGRRRIEMLDVAKSKRNTLTTITVENTDIIGEYAFAECENLQEVIIGKGVKSIERGAFAFCPNLKRVIFPKELESIGNDAFKECTSLEEVEIVSNLTRIGDRAFSDCSSLRQVTMKKNVGSIGDEAFLGCEALLAVSMPRQLKSIGKSAFKDCSKLISISIPEGTEVIGEGAFENCCSEQNYTEIPKMVQGSDKIEWHRVDLPNWDVVVMIPDSVKQIGKSAFKNCKNIVYVHMGDEYQLENIEEETFAGCERLQAIDIPQNVKAIKDSAFSGCKSLTDITLPKGFEEIGNKSFENCQGLRLVITNGEIKKKLDSFLNANSAREANIKDINFKNKNIGGKQYEVISAPEDENRGKITLASIKKVLTMKIGQER